jgi:transposase
MQHRTRDLLLRQRTQVINALRAHLAELGIVAAQVREGLKTLLEIIAKGADERLPADARASLIVLAAQLQALQTMIAVTWIPTRSILKGRRRSRPGPTGCRPTALCCWTFRT